MIKLLPREPMTKKAKSAISKYATIRCGDLPIHGLMVGYVLDAEKMPRVKLYAWLERKGYRWLARHGFWEKSK